MLYKIIFTKGHLDDLESLEKGVTGDILISNEEDVYFNPQYITIERVNYEFGIDKECYLEENLVLMHQITQETILKSIPHLHKWMFFEYWRPISDEILRKYFYPKEDWFILKWRLNNLSTQEARYNIKLAILFLSRAVVAALVSVRTNQ